MAHLVVSLVVPINNNEEELIEIYDKIIKQIKTGAFELSTDYYSTMINDVALVHLKSKNAELSQRVLFFLGYLLSNPNSEEFISQEEALMIIDDICNIRDVEQSKILAQRALWCLSTQKLQIFYVEKRIVEILHFVRRVFIAQTPVSPLVASEILALLKKLMDVNVEKFWSTSIDFLTNLVVKFSISSSSKVREKSFGFLESHFNRFQTVVQSDSSKYKETLLLINEDFLKLVNSDPKFAFKFWKLLVSLFGEMLAKSISLLKAFMPIVEAGFKSDDQATRCLALESWRHIISTIFSSNAALSKSNETKLVNLFLQPLICGSKSSEKVAMEKLQTWCCLMNALDTKLEEYFDKVISTRGDLLFLVCVPLLRFCVGGEFEFFSTPASGFVTPKSSRSSKTPTVTTPETPKLYLRNRPGSVGPKVLPSYSSVQFYLGEILLAFLCGDEKVVDFDRKLNLRLSTSCLNSSKTFVKNLSLLIQCLRIWASSTTNIGSVTLRCWQQITTNVLNCKIELASDEFETLFENFMSQFRQFLLEVNTEKNILSELKALLISVVQDVSKGSTNAKSFTGLILSPSPTKSKHTDHFSGKKLLFNKSGLDDTTDEQICVNSSNSIDPIVAPLALGSSPSSNRSKRSRKKLNLDDNEIVNVDKDDDVLYVPPPCEKKQMVLTEHQKEKFCERKEMPYLNRIDSQSVDHIDPVMFVTESQLIQEIDADKTVDSSRKKSDDIRSKQTSKSVAVAASDEPIVLLTKLDDYEIQILTHPTADSNAGATNATSNNWFKNLVVESLAKKTKSKMFRKSKSLDDLRSVVHYDDDCLFSSYHPTSVGSRISGRRRRSCILKCPTKFDDYVVANRFGRNKVQKVAGEDSSGIMNDKTSTDCRSVASTLKKRRKTKKLTSSTSFYGDATSRASAECVAEMTSIKRPERSASAVANLYDFVSKEYSCSGSNYETVQQSDVVLEIEKTLVALDSLDAVHESQINETPSSVEENISHVSETQETVVEELLLADCQKFDDNGKKFVENSNEEENLANNTSTAPDLFTEHVPIVREMFVEDTNLHNNIVNSPSSFVNGATRVENFSTPKKSFSESCASELFNEELSLSKSRRIISPRLTPSASGILKRKRDLAEFDQFSLTPPSAGRRQVHFAPESVAESDDEMGRIRNSPRKRARLDLSPVRTLSPSFVGGADLINKDPTTVTLQTGFVSKFSARTHVMISLINNSSTKSKCSSDELNDSLLSSLNDDNIVMTSESVLNNSLPVWPSLANDCADVAPIVSALVSSSWKDGLLQELRVKRVFTVGDLARLTELDVHHLPIKQPKIETLKKALENYELETKQSKEHDSSYMNISGVVLMDEESKTHSNATPPLIQQDCQPVKVANVNADAISNNRASSPSSSTLPSGQPECIFRRNSSSTNPVDQSPNVALSALLEQINEEFFNSLARDEKLKFLIDLQKIQSILLNSLYSSG